MSRLADEAGVSDRTVFKAEVEPNARLRHSTLEKIAKPLGLHPNGLFIRANLTPYLSASGLTGERSAHERKERAFNVTDEEYDHLERYLNFLQFSGITGHVAPEGQRGSADLVE